MRRYGLAFLSMIVVALLVVARSSAAQTAEPAVWPPDPKKIFTENVRVISEQRFNEPAPYTLVQQGERWYLREDATGKLSSALPENFAVGEYTNKFIATTPDADWLLIYAGARVEGSEADLSPQAYFAYNTRLDIAQFIGVVDQLFTRTIQFRWLTNHILFVELRDMPEWSISYGYVGDITQINSFHLVLQTMRLGIGVAALNKSLYKWDTPTNDYQGDGSPKLQCAKTNYFVDTNQAESLHYDTLCVPDFIASNGTGYYAVRVDKFGGDVGIYDVLFGYEPQTGKAVSLYTGYFSQVVWVSPDEKQAVVQTDANGYRTFLSGHSVGCGSARP